MSMDSIVEVFKHLNKMLIATKHIADFNFVNSMSMSRESTSLKKSSGNCLKPAKQ